jgi:uncharacterized membrane protein (DUF485 family)
VHLSLVATLRLRLFALYLALYLGFVLLTAFDVRLLGWAPFGGVNLAIVYGFLLIGTAFALAVVYWWLARGTDEAGGGR